MSRIYVHSQNQQSGVLGAERHYLGGLVSNLFALSLGMTNPLGYDSDSHRTLAHWFEPFESDRVRIPGSGYWEGNPMAFRTLLKVSVEGHFHLPSSEEPFPVFSMALNTAMAIGSDAVRLAARIHGQCEIHAFVEEESRHWLAGIVAQAQQFGIFRPGMGWDDVIEHLRRSHDGPVVLSYSVTERFPDESDAIDGGTWVRPEGEDGEPDWDAWYHLPIAERWDLAMVGLRNTAQEKWLELRPDWWDYPDMYFGPEPMTGFELLAEASGASSVGDERGDS
jgi:hypothetical protein